MFRHPNYYKELRKAGNELAKRNAVKEDLACSGSSLARNRERVIICSAAPKTDQAISPTRATAPSRRATGPGPKQQASSVKLTDPQATSDKHQAPRHKRQA